MWYGERLAAVAWAHRSFTVGRYGLHNCGSIPGVEGFCSCQYEKEETGRGYRNSS
jgi:hypothetical protein